MLKPNESLDDYVVKALPETTEPPRPVSLRLTGEVEVLKPLARWERPVKLVPAALQTTPPRLSWFHRSLVMGGGFAVAALVFASAIVIGVSDPGQPETTQVEFIEVPNEADRPLPAEDPLSSDIFTVAESTSEAPVPTRTRKTRAYQKRNVRAAAPVRAVVRKKKPVAGKEPHQSLVSKFVPTTLVIYIENGLIKSRIEPWTADRK